MDCNQNTDPLKLVREGTSQKQRISRALDPAYAPLNERTPAHGMVFAQAYARYLTYYTTNDVAFENWQPFFSQDISVQLAVAAIQDVETYKVRVKETVSFLNDRANQAQETELKNHLGYLFSYIGTLARQVDRLKETLPTDTPLKSTLQNLIKSQLAPAFERLIGYYKAGYFKPKIDADAVEEELDETDRLIADVQPDVVLLGGTTVPFSTIYKSGLSNDWITDEAGDWATFRNKIPHQPAVYGSGTTVFDKINHVATHNLFTSVFDQFLKVYARTVADAKAALEDSFTNQDNHQPHYALFLAFLRLQEYARQETNTLTGRHLDFYYRDILRLREKPAQPGHAHLLLELAKYTDSYLLKQGELFKAGKDDLGKDVFFASDTDFVANQAMVTALQSVYRHNAEAVTDEGANAGKQVGRLYASPVANSQDGLGAKLISADGSWHPFLNKTYQDGTLTQILMPKAEIGFAVASQYLYLTEGHRIVSLTFQFTEKITANAGVTVYLTTEKGWFSLPANFTVTDSVTASLTFTLEADKPAILPYNQKLHGGDFRTEHPVVKVVLSQDVAQVYAYAELEAAVVESCTISVSVGLDTSGTLNKPGLKSLAVSNDFGPVDVSKPFQPFGPVPQKNASLLIGSKEVFQKASANIKLGITWRGTVGTSPTLTVSYLNKAAWVPLGIPINLNTNPIALTLPAGYAAANDYTPNEFFSTASVAGFLKLAINADFGHKKWQADLLTYFANLSSTLTKTGETTLKKINLSAETTDTATLEISKGATIDSGTNNLPTAPETPEIEAINLGYSATSAPILLNSVAASELAGAKFYHLSPFGLAERQPGLNTNAVTNLLPQFSHSADGVSKRHKAEFYIGITALQPPQTLALLVQVADGTADPNAEKPKNHLHWSYLRNNNWVAFGGEAVNDTTGEFTRSGIVTLDVPVEATSANTLLPTGMHWIRVAVTEAPEAVCRLIRVAAQALRVTFTDRTNDPAFPAKVLPAGTISKLDQPDAAIKKVEQPFETFGGRGTETSESFYTRISERLRHKDRAIALWDYERLVLEAFPQIYRVKCLNHTQYEPGTGIYKELAPGHVTIVTLPNQYFQNQRDPLKPFTSLGLLKEIEAFLSKRLSCFVKLHVKNPQFEGVRVSFRVKFYDGFDETFYKTRLQEAIVRFLSPWAFAGGEGPSFGGKIAKSVLINFVEEQPYVDYLTDFQLFHDINNVAGTEDKQEIEASKAVSILVSVTGQIPYYR